jgi:predicted ATP-grasp superfamily ATP-dependent carboligase
MADEHLLIFGASARAAACSALRAGLRPWCADLFADADLQVRCPAMRLPGRYPHAFLDLAATELPGPWMYTGGLENWPALVGRMARRRPLWGNGEGELVHARHPGLVKAVLDRAGLPAPSVGFERGLLVPRGRWLVKPLRSAGGRGVHFLNEHPPDPEGRGVPVYYQEHIDGEPYSLLYAGDGKRTWCLGLTRQLVGAAWLHAGPFQYCGSVGPLDLGAIRRPAPEQLGNVVVAGCGLRGLFGIDGVLRDGTFWPVEINPRYTASVEVLEHATGLQALAWHRRAFVAPSPSPPWGGSGQGEGGRPVVGKAILFARADLTFPADGPWRDMLRSPPPVTELPTFADVPTAGEVIATGHPVLTLFARAESAAACEGELRRAAADLDRRLFGG